MAIKRLLRDQGELSAFLETVHILQRIEALERTQFQALVNLANA
jgi:hypothetical protein